MNTNRVVGTSILLLAAFVLAPLAHADIGASTGSATTYSGRAIAVSVHIPSLADLAIADTGDLPPSGGDNDATVLTVNNQLVQAEVLLSVTMGFDNAASSTAAIADLVLLPGSQNQITADFVKSDTTVTCNSASASSEIVGLQIAGSTIVVTGSPNQVVNTPVGTLTINSQSTSQGSTNSATAIALDLLLLNGDEIKVSFAHSDIACGSIPTPTVTKDFMTGGGFIVVNGVKDTFGFVAGFKPGETSPSGHLNYIDHQSGDHIQSISVDSYTGSGVCRTFSGPGTDNGQQTNYSVRACDNADPGNGSDTFEMQLSNNYQPSGTLGGGNIKLHT